MNGRGAMGGGGAGNRPPGGGSPLAAPPKGFEDPHDHSQFHTIIKRITGEEVLDELAQPYGQVPLPPPGPNVVVGGGASPPPVPTGLQAPYASAPAPELGQTHLSSDAPQGAPHEARRQGKLVVLFGCKGGVGNTFLGLNLAVSLGRFQNVCLVDMDLQMGDVLTSLNMEGRCAISHLVRDLRSEGQSFNPRSVLDRHESSGVYVLSQVHCLEELDLVKPHDMGNLLAFMKLRFPYIIVDGLRGFDDNSMLIMDAADAIIVVVNQDVPSVRSAARSIEIFRRIGYQQTKVMVVINRFYKKALVTPDYVSMSLKNDQVFTVRDDFKLAVKTLNEGVPLNLLAPQSKICHDVDMLAEHLRDKKKKGQGDAKKSGLGKLKFWS